MRGRTAADKVRWKERIVLNMENRETVPENAAKTAGKRMSLDQLMESGKAQVADLVEAQIRVGNDPFGKGMRFISRDGNFCVKAEDENGDVYIIETKKKSKYQDMYQQIFADLRRENDSLKAQGKENKVIVIVCSNDPSNLVKQAAQENRDIRIYRFFLEYNVMR